ncbi:MAG: lysophospholipid acyltransferase family protein [Pseudolysinimonas sp.]
MSEWVYTGAITLGRGLLGGIWRVKTHIDGAENIPDAGGAVIAITHFGYLEFALVEWVTWHHNRRRIRFMAKIEAFKRWPIGAFMRNMKHIPVDRKAGSAAFSAAIEALRAGELVGVFPEGTVSRAFEVQPLKTGAARLAAEAGVPIIPVAVWGGHRLMAKGQKSRMRERFGVPVLFSFGPPIVISETHDVHQATDELQRELQQRTERLQADYPVDGAGRWWQPHRRGGSAPTVAEVAAQEAERARNANTKGRAGKP